MLNFENESVLFKLRTISILFSKKNQQQIYRVFHLTIVKQKQKCSLFDHTKAVNVLINGFVFHLNLVLFLRIKILLEIDL